MERRWWGPAECAMLLGASALFLLAARAPAASAQSGAPRLRNADVPVLPGGVLMITTGDNAYPDPGTIVVTDGMENDVVGAIEVPMLDNAPLILATPLVWFWRPVEPLAAGRRFKVETMDREIGEIRSFIVETATEPIDRALDPAWFKVELLAHAVDRGEHTECCENQDFPSRCFAPSLVMEPQLRVTVDESVSSPVVGQLLYQVTSTDPQEMQNTFRWADRTVVMPAFEFRDQREQYCVLIDVYDAVTRQQMTLPERCVPNQPELFEGTVPKKPENIAAALGVSGCQRPPDGYEQQWCETNQGTCFPADWAGCQHFDELCPDYPRSANEAGPDTGVVDEDAEPDAGTKPSSASAGCGCKVIARSTSPRWLFPLAALALLTRLRRARS